MFSSFSLRFFNGRRNRMNSRKTEIKPPTLKRKQQVLKLVGAPLSFAPCIHSAL